VSRRKAATRRLINEIEFLADIKSTFEFQVIENESLTLKEQLISYSSAEFVIGPHGAGLTNIVFANNPRALLEFWHSIKQPFFENISRDLNISYLVD
jgi:capsular polysaccharide biosynthesis protein